MRQSKTGQNVRAERHELRMIIKDIGSTIEKYSHKDQARYSHVVTSLTRLKQRLPGTKGAITTMQQKDFFALINLVAQGKPEADQYYEKYYKKSIDYDVIDLAESTGLTVEKARELVTKNRNRIIARINENRNYLKQFTVEENEQEQPDTYTDLQTHYHDTIVDALNRSAYVCAGTVGRNDQHFDAGGICDNHAYSVLDAFTDPKNGKKYVIVRDPHGGAGTVTKKDADGNNTMAISEEETYGVNQLELKYFLSRFKSIYING